MSRNAEEWAKECSHKPASVRVESWNGRLLCLDCARAYAREVLEAWREQAAQIADETARLHEERGATLEVGVRMGLTRQEVARGLAAALRALPEEGTA